MGLFSIGTTNAQQSIYDISLNDINGKEIQLSKFQGKKILFVNVASYCGFTSQYTELEKLHQLYRNDLVVIGLPCNQFGSQEPDSHKEILEFCEKEYGVSFLISEKIQVKGEGQHRLYRWLTKKSINGKSSSKVRWNFQKYLVDEKGELLNFFYSTTKPMSSKIIDYLK